MSALANTMKRFIDICAGIAGCLTLIPLIAFVKYKYVMICLSALHLLYRK